MQQFLKDKRKIQFEKFSLEEFHCFQSWAVMEVVREVDEAVFKAEIRFEINFGECLRTISEYFYSFSEFIKKSIFLLIYN